MKRAKRKEGGGLYFSDPTPSRDLIRSGCTLLDLITGGPKGAWPLGRVINIVGDKSTGKTLLAIEATANFCLQYPNGIPFYREAEEAFDKPYAGALGMPIDRVRFWDDEYDDPLDTVEKFYKDLKAATQECKKKGVPGLYVLDALDALSDDAEMKREDLEKEGYGVAKAFKMSLMFRKIIGLVSQANMCVIIISQIRDNIGAMFGKKSKRSGGKAMDFYCSLVVWLSYLGEIQKTRKGVKRTVGIKIKAKCEKNKITVPFRACEFPIRFGYGIDDLEANLNWLMEVNRTEDIDLSKKAAKEIVSSLDNINDEEYAFLSKRTKKAVKSAWREIETGFLPKRKKYS